MSTIIIVLACAYLEYGRVEWSGKSFYRRTVDYSDVVWC